MNRKTLIQILKQITIDFAYSSDGKQLNSFVVLNNPLDLLHTSFGATYSDYLGGHFWSRKWVNQGASLNDVQGEFPLLSVEQRTTTISSILTDLREFEVYLMVADKSRCDSCARKHDRTPEEVNTNTSEMLNAYLRELTKYGKYRVTIDAQTSDIWMSEGRMNYLNTEGAFDTEPILLQEMADRMIVNDSYRITELRLTDGYFGHGMKLIVEGCEASSIDFDYTATDLATVAQTICDSCR